VGKANSGFVYLTWNSAGFSIPDAFTTIGSYGFADVVFSKSTTGGASWSVSGFASTTILKAVPCRYQTNSSRRSAPTKPAGSESAFYDRRRDSNNFLIDRYLRFLEKCR